MSYAIMRIRKIKNYAESNNAEKHNIRAKQIDHIENPNIKIVYGEKDVKSKIQLLVKTVEKVQKKKLRKDAVRCLDIFMGSDNEFFRGADLDAWVNKNIKYLEETYSSKNLLMVSLHLDEESIHLHAFVSPIYADNFNAKHWLGGRQSFIDMQNKYYEYMKEFGLQRGKSKEVTQAEHTDTKSFRELKKRNKILETENAKLKGYIEIQYKRTFKKTYGKEPSNFDLQLFRESLQSQIDTDVKADKQISKYIDDFIKKSKDEGLEL